MALLGKKSLTTILSSFNTVISDLEKLEAANKAEVTKNEEQIAKLSASNTSLNDESSKALSVREKIAALIGK